ncbi:MAG: chemotaxis response regulator protein-glutamate methylesterase [Gammaproteobacteria bacterium]|nr:chemotaxis response regulator protein-glutamate methylesterase [Gammaproteobacteria bacterium]
MPVRVLVVDDSSFFRRQISNILNEHPQIEVIDTAEDGNEAVEKVIKLKPDVITMDVEMPNLNGIDATRKIMSSCPSRILMFSSLTMEGARATLAALEAGAIDFLPKRFEDITRNKDEAKKMLCERIISIAKGAVIQPVSPPPVPWEKKRERPKAAVTETKPRAPEPKPAPVAQPERRESVRHRKTGKQYSVLAIGTSTGGPAALQEVLSKLPQDFHVPVLLVQHMPGTFTPAFAQRLDEICQIHVKEAQDGDMLKPGVAYLAPGGKQMIVKKRGSEATIKLGEGDMHSTYKPSVDITFESVADAFGGDVLALVLTGMGADGREGAKKLKKLGATIWVQDEVSCVVYGMPAAVKEAGIVDKVLALGVVGDTLVQEI